MQKILLVIAYLITINVAFASKKPKLSFQRTEKFRIVQFTDIHHEVGNQASDEVLSKLSVLLDSIKPDMVFFTGDIVISKEIFQGWDEVLNMVIARRIPWAVVFGNHDDEQGWTRERIMKYITTKPYCLAERGPTSIQGVGNYVIRIKKSTNKQTAAILYGLDSNAYSKGYEPEKYGFFDFSQVNWFCETSKKLTKENKNQPYPSLAFFHIPLREYGFFKDSINFQRFGHRYEIECYGALNTGMFAAMQLSGSVMATFTGHDHKNDYIGKLYNVCLAYGRFSGGTTTYGNITNGARVIELTENVRGFTSWIHTTNNQIFDRVEFDGKTLVSIH
jgi:hypothetical protein